MSLHSVNLRKLGGGLYGGLGWNMLDCRDIPAAWRNIIMRWKSLGTKLLRMSRTSSTQLCAWSHSHHIRRLEISSSMKAQNSVGSDWMGKICLRLEDRVWCNFIGQYFTRSLISGQAEKSRYEVLQEQENTCHSVSHEVVLLLFRAAVILKDSCYNLVSESLVYVETKWPLILFHSGPMNYNEKGGDAQS